MLMTLEEAYASLKEPERVRAAMIADARVPDYPIVYCTQGILALTGYRPDEMVGRNARFLQGPDTDPDTVAAIRRALSRRQPISIDILNYRKDGEPFWNRLTIRPSFDRAGDLEHFIGMQMLIAEDEVRREVVPLRFG